MNIDWRFRITTEGLVWPQFLRKPVENTPDSY